MGWYDGILNLVARNGMGLSPAANVRAADGTPKPYSVLNPVRGSNSQVPDAVMNNEYITAILDITVDDICIGDQPVSVNHDSDAPNAYAEFYAHVAEEFNDIVKWAARDLCAYGYSVYTVHRVGADGSVEGDPDSEEQPRDGLRDPDRMGEERKHPRISLMPYVGGVTFYLTKDKRVVAYALDDNPSYGGGLVSMADRYSHEQRNLENVVIFINYDKGSLIPLTDIERLPKDDPRREFAFGIAPQPMQLKNISRTVQTLNLLEGAMTRYRVQLSRIARWANVDMGLSHGDNEQNDLDKIGTAINANSMSLDQGIGSDMNNLSFDDAIPIVPNRNGIGRPDIVSDVPNYEIAKMADLEYYMGKLTLGTRFPATYLDFQNALGNTAVSMIRADLRYSKLTDAVRSRIASTINSFVLATPELAQYNPVYSLTTLPNSEDGDVVAALGDFINLASSVEEFVIPNGTEGFDAGQSLHRLRLVKDLFNGVAISPQMQKWFDDYEEYITDLQAAQESDVTDSPDDMGGDMGGFDELGGAF